METRTNSKGTTQWLDVQLRCLAAIRSLVILLVDEGPAAFSLHILPVCVDRLPTDPRDTVGYKGGKIMDGSSQNGLWLYSCLLNYACGHTCR